MVVQGQFVEPSLFNTIHADGGAGRRAANDLRVTPEPTICNNRGQPVGVDNVVDLWLGGYRHGHSSGSSTNSVSSSASLSASASSGGSGS